MRANRSARMGGAWPIWTC